MKRKQVSICALLLSGTLFLSACGGGSSSSSNPPPQTPSGTAISAQFVGAAPTAVAYQTGTGNWTAASLQSGSLNFSVPQGTSTYSVAYVCPTWQGMGPVSNEYILEATTKDPATFSVSCFMNPTPGTITGNVNVSAIATATQFRVYGSQFLSSSLTSGTSGAFSFQAPTGTNDIAVLAYDSSNNLVGVKIVRNQTVPGAVSGTITLSSNDAITTMQTMAASNIPAGFLTPPAGPYAEYTTSNKTSFSVSNAGTTATQYALVPASEAQSGDYYWFSANTAGGSNQHVYASQSVATSGPITLAFPAPLASVAPTVSTLPTFTVNYGGFSADSAVAYSGNIQWTTNSTTDTGITVTATAAYQNGATTLAIPDLTSVSGFFPAPASGASVSWFLYVYGGTYQWFAPVPASGTLTFVQNEGTYTQP
jgi:hypothetical protein